MRGESASTTEKQPNTGPLPVKHAKTEGTDHHADLSEECRNACLGKTFSYDTHH